MTTLMGFVTWRYEAFSGGWTKGSVRAPMAP